jgi:hypothetical protein
MSGIYAEQINKCREELAVLYLANSSYLDASKVFESLAAEPILKHKSHRNIVTAILCHLRLDSVSAESLLETYMKQNVSFSDTTDCKFIVNVIKAFTAHDCDGFKDHCRVYDHFRKLDQVQLNLLLQIQNIIQTAADSLA